MYVQKRVSLMSRWELLSNERARVIWDNALVRFDDCAPFQTYAWGEYRRGLGWEPYRWAAFNEKHEIIAMIQGYLRRYILGIGMVWSEGGPVGDLSICNQSLQQAIIRTTGVRRLYCRFRCDRARDVKDALVLSGGGWKMPWASLTSDYSMTLDLSLDEKTLLASCERNWRRNLKRSKECDLSVRQWLNPSIDEILKVFVVMQNVKGLEEQHSRDEIEQLLKNVGPQLALFRCEDRDGELVSLSGALVVGDRACSVLMATNDKGRALHASYAAFWKLIQHCRAAGVRKYDLAGIDPVRNPGVYRFKRATGAAHLELLGEWDWASRPWLRWFGNWAIEQRNRIKRPESAWRKPHVTKEKTEAFTVESVQQIPVTSSPAA